MDLPHRIMAALVLSAYVIASIISAWHHEFKSCVLSIALMFTTIMFIKHEYYPQAK